MDYRMEIASRVAELTGRELFEEHVVVRIRRRYDDSARRGIAKDGAFHMNEALGLDVLDDLDKRRRVVTPQPRIAVDKRALQEFDARPHTVRQSL